MAAKGDCKLTSAMMRDKYKSCSVDPHLLTEKLSDQKIMDHLVGIVDSKGDDVAIPTKVFNILVKNLRRKLMASGECDDPKTCEVMALKLATFIQSIMKETYLREARRKVESLDKTMERESAGMGTIKEEDEERSEKTVKLHIPAKSEQNINTFKKEKVKVKQTEPPKRKPEVKVEAVKMVEVKKDEAKEPIGKLNKEDILKWASRVSDHTAQMTKWIEETTAKADLSRKRLKSGESIDQVKSDWKQFIAEKRSNSTSVRDSELTMRVDPRHIQARTREWSRRQAEYRQWLARRCGASTSDSEDAGGSTSSVWSGREPISGSSSVGCSRPSSREHRPPLNLPTLPNFPVPPPRAEVFRYRLSSRTYE